MLAKNIVRSVNLSYSRGPMSLWSSGMGYDVSLPIIDIKKDYLVFEQEGDRVIYRRELSKLIVRGKSWIKTHYSDGQGGDNYLVADYEKRWCTIPAQDMATMLRIADRDGTIRDMRMLSMTAGIGMRFQGQTQPMDNRFVGTEPALILQLDGSQEAHQLAEQYSFNFQVQRNISLASGQEQEVTYTNALIISKAAADAALGVNTYPTEERVQSIPPKTDPQNPDWELAIEMARTIGRLPERQKRS